RLELDGDRCVGCDACVEACPVDVVRMRDTVTWGEFTGPTRIVYRADRPTGPLGAVARTRPSTDTAVASANDGERGDGDADPPAATDAS
ncbi:MAG: 4Fe-4S binding protein, partial [bacterium]|nr:4Fe-4S binding protein [bacterium]